MKTKKDKILEKLRKLMNLKESVLHWVTKAKQMQLRQA